MISSTIINKIIRKVALGVGVIADGIMIFICFIMQPNEPIAQVAFAALGITIVLLIPITKNEGAFKLWLCLVFIAIFFDTSYLLASTKTSGAIVETVETDQYLKQLSESYEQSLIDFNSQQLSYSQALKDPSITTKTMALVDKNFNDAKLSKNEKEKKKTDRYELVKSGKVISIRITADIIFNAIPDAIWGHEQRRVQAFIYGLMAIVIQGMIVFALNRKKKVSRIKFIIDALTNRLYENIENKLKIKSVIDRPFIDISLIENFVTANWIGLRSNNTKKILSPQSFIEFYSTRGGFNVDDYKKIKQRAIDRQVITPGDEIILSNESDAIEALRG
jgi:hypothetical protein